jgi:hypothetical protein
MQINLVPPMTDPNSGTAQPQAYYAGLAHARDDNDASRFARIRQDEILSERAYDRPAPTQVGDQQFAIGTLLPAPRLANRPINREFCILWRDPNVVTNGNCIGCGDFFNTTAHKLNCNRDCWQLYRRAK